MFKVLYEHNSHRELFINGLRKQIDEKLRSRGRAKCPDDLAGSTVHTYMYMYMYVCTSTCTCMYMYM